MPTLSLRLKQWLCFLIVAAVGFTAFADEAAPGESSPDRFKPVSPSLLPIKDTPGLPRVLLIGDSISIGYTLPTRKELEGKANVHRPPTNCGSTRSGLKNLGAWLGDGKWDVIHFNWGLHDLKYLESGRQNVPLDQYEKNLRELVGRLKKTGAVLIFATTTPLVRETSGRYRRDAQAETLYNEVAKEIMLANGVRVNDLHSLALPKAEAIQTADGIHFNRQGSLLLSRQVAASITEALAGGEAR